MKVFLVSTPVGETEHGEIFNKLYAEIQKLGYTHTSDLITHTSDEFLTKMKEGKQAHKEFYKAMIDGINNADICVFEASTPSFGVGYLIQSALSSSKPTIVLFYKELKSNLLPGIDDEKLVYHTYDESNYKKIIKKSLDEAREKRDKRFNFFLSPKLLNYLETTSNNQGVTKSKILRDMIVDHMRKSNTVVEE